DRQNCAQRAEHPQRHRGHTRAKQKKVHFLGPRLDESRQARIQVTKPAPYGATQLLRIAVRTDNQVGLTRGGLQQGHKHRRLRLLGEDRKSTRLNSSHGSISYAVFCLKKKKQTYWGKGTQRCPRKASRARGPRAARSRS